ncbi:hypothetical protein RIF29_24040 [Crotalaria pallida]|uniref:Uncharacterized protein n=1 Tax=Crotalaria pallida TaxID=3830 RepID=A0AAN9EJK5_CROPI
MLYGPFPSPIRPTRVHHYFLSSSNLIPHSLTGDAVILLHVSPTNVLFGADWGSINTDEETVNHSDHKLEDDFDAFTASESADLAKDNDEADTVIKPVDEHKKVVV